MTTAIYSDGTLFVYFTALAYWWQLCK